MEKYEILWLEGDGSGPELRREAIKVINTIEALFGHNIRIKPMSLGAQAYFTHGSCYPEETRTQVKSGNFHAIVKEPVGLDAEGTKKLKEAGVKVENEAIISVRVDLDAYAGYRPGFLPKDLSFFSPLRPEIIGTGLDILFLRELTGGVYSGPKVEGVDKAGNISDFAKDDCTYTRNQVERIARVAFKEARKRGVKLTDVHKANIKATGRFWKAIFDKIGRTEFPDVRLEDCLVDAFSTYMKTRPTSFNGVVAAENFEADIETDDIAGVMGSLGLMPSACWNPESKTGYFEPSHGSAPTIAGQGIVNPYAMIGSIAYMFDMALGLKEESKAIWDALIKVFSQGNMTRELVRKLSAEEKKARADDDSMRLYSAFKRIKDDITREQANELILEANEKYDRKLELRVVSTSQFGNLVCEQMRRA